MTHFSQTLLAPSFCVFQDSPSMPDIKKNILKSSDDSRIFHFQFLNLVIFRRTITIEVEKKVQFYVH